MQFTGWIKRCTIVNHKKTQGAVIYDRRTVGNYHQYIREQCLNGKLMGHTQNSQKEAAWKGLEGSSEGLRHIDPATYPQERHQINLQELQRHQSDWLRRKDTLSAAS